MKELFEEFLKEKKHVKNLFGEYLTILPILFQGPDKVRLGTDREKLESLDP